MNLWRSLARASPTVQLRATAFPRCSTRRMASNAPVPRPLPANFITPLRHKLSNDQHLRALDFFHEYMKRNSLDSESRFAAYVKAITLFMVYGHLTEATTIYARMKAEGYIPPRPIQATLAIMRTLAVESSKEALLHAAAKAFYSESFSEEDFRTVLRIIYRQTRLSSSIYDALIKLFRQSRGSESYTLSAKTKAWLSSVRTRRGPPGQVFRYPRAPVGEEPARAYDENRAAEFATLRSMAEREPELAPVIYAALQRMEFSGGAHDRLFYNVLLSAMEGKQRYAEVFTLYRMLMAGDIAILPDAFTFGTVRRAVTDATRKRTARTRRFKKPPNTPSLRQLFRDILHCHERFTSSRAPFVAANGSLLNKIVSGFMAARDYAAAFVAIRTYELLDIPVTLATYRAVVCSLISRLEKELPSIESSTAPNQFWGYRYLGYCPQDLDVRLAEDILQSGGESELHLQSMQYWSRRDAVKHAEAVSAYVIAGSSENKEGVTYRHIWNEKKGKSGYTIPTAVILLGMLDNTMDKFSATPLQRILRRALLAEHPRTFLAPSKVISIDIRHAKSEMLPTSKSPQQ